MFHLPEKSGWWLYSIIICSAIRVLNKLPGGVSIVSTVHLPQFIAYIGQTYRPTYGQCLNPTPTISVVWGYYIAVGPKIQHHNLGRHTLADADGYCIYLKWAVHSNSTFTAWCSRKWSRNSPMKAAPGCGMQLLQPLAAGRLQSDDASVCDLVAKRAPPSEGSKRCLAPSLMPAFNDQFVYGHLIVLMQTCSRRDPARVVCCLSEVVSIKVSIYRHLESHSRCRILAQRTSDAIILLWLDADKTPTTI